MLPLCKGCEQHKAAEAALTSPALKPFLSVYKKKQRMSQKWGERTWEKESHISEQEKDREGAQFCRHEQLIRLPHHTTIQASQAEMVFCSMQLPQPYETKKSTLTALQ